VGKGKRVTAGAVARAICGALVVFAAVLLAAALACRGYPAPASPPPGPTPGLDAAVQRSEAHHRHLLVGLSKRPYLIKTEDRRNMKLQFNERDIDRSFFLLTDRMRIAVGSPPESTNVPRGTIKGFSDRSSRRLKEYLTNALAEYEYFGTLTVADDILTPALFKAAQGRFFTWFMREQRGRVRARCHDDLDRDRTLGAQLSSVSLCWFLEFQQRGAPHLHFFYTDFVPWRRAASKWCDSIDQPWAFETATKFEKLRSAGSGSGIAAYAQKAAGYASKAEQKTDPLAREWGRWWGVRGLRETVSATSRLEVKRHNFSQLVAASGLLEQRMKSAHERGEVNIVPWKNGGGVSAYFTRTCSPQTRALLYGAMSALFLHSEASTRGQGDADEDDPSWRAPA
jgi:hypothetical protein